MFSVRCRTQHAINQVTMQFLPGRRLKQPLDSRTHGPRRKWPGTSKRDPDYCLPLTIMSFLTDFTPLTLRAILTAFLIAALELTKPVS